MTTNIYVTSTQTFSGKSALCVGLLSRFTRDGFVVGYMKPVSTTACMVGNQLVDEDAHFVKTTFSLTDPLEAMAPVILTDKRVAAILSGGGESLDSQVQSAYQTIATDKDIVVLEGGGSLREGWIVNLAPPHVINLLQARTLVLVPYDNDLQLVDDLITARVRLGDSLVGAIINRVPSHRIGFVQSQVKPFVERHNVPIFAILPKQRVLLSVSVAELAEKLGGEVLCSHHAVDELVENLMVGAMSVDSALTYFRRKPNKAVITGGDRPDIQLAALETSTHCLILTGNLRPSPLILGRAEEAGVPIILTRHDTMTAVQTIETFFGKTRFHQGKKVRSFESLLSKHTDFEALYTAFGLH
jgi:BioD-like phosphotransacetylase family protein